MARITDDDYDQAVYVQGVLRRLNDMTSALWKSEQVLGRLLHQLKWYRNREKGLMRQVELLRKQLAEAQKDTARLDWMADNSACFDRIVYGFEHEPEITPTLRSAIDAEADKGATWLS